MRKINFNVARISGGTSFHGRLLNYEAEKSASWEHRSGQPGVQLWSVQPDEDQLQREAPQSTGAGANSRLIPSAFCVSDNHAYLTGRIKHVHFFPEFRIRIRLGQRIRIQAGRKCP